VIVTSSIDYSADGLAMVGHLAYDDAVEGKRPAVLVSHEGPGLDVHAKDVADQLAALGYVAFALDYMGEGRPAPMDQMMGRLGALMGDVDRIRALAHAGLDVLLAQPQTDPDRVVSVGYCFGGTTMLELARSGADIKATVGMHSGLGTSRPQDASAIRGIVLVCIGTEDPIIPPEQRADFEAEMRAGEVDWRMYLYGGAAHSFTNPHASDLGMAGIAFHRPSDERSWRAMLDGFTEAVGAP
jgi:dienelactone hydrolase